MPQGKHTGNGLPPRKREMVLALLRSGHGIREICRKTHVAHDTIMGLRDIEIEQIRTGKEILAARCDRIAMRGTDHLIAQLDHPNAATTLSPQQLVPIIGVAIEKSIMLRADPTIHVLHQHTHKHLHAHITETSVDNILAHLPDDVTDSQGESIPVIDVPPQKALPNESG